MAPELRRTQSDPGGPSQSDTLARSKTNPGNGLHTLLSPQFMDDHSTYHHHPHDTEDTWETDDSTISDVEKAGDEEEAEVRDGIKDLRDIETQPSRLSRLKSTKDPNLVSARVFYTAVIYILMEGRSPGMVLMIRRIRKIGLSKGNGLQPSLYLHSRSYLLFRPRWLHQPYPQWLVTFISQRRSKSR